MCVITGRGRLLDRAQGRMIQEDGQGSRAFGCGRYRGKKNPAQSGVSCLVLGSFYKALSRGEERLALSSA